MSSCLNYVKLQPKVNEHCNLRNKKIFYFSLNKRAKELQKIIKCWARKHNCHCHHHSKINFGNFHGRKKMLKLGTFLLLLLLRWTVTACLLMMPQVKTCQTCLVPWEILFAVCCCKTHFTWEKKVEQSRLAVIEGTNYKVAKISQFIIFIFQWIIFSVSHIMLLSRDENCVAYSIIDESAVRLDNYFNEHATAAVEPARFGLENRSRQSWSPLFCYLQPLPTHHD